MKAFLPLMLAVGFAAQSVRIPLLTASSSGSIITQSDVTLLGYSTVPGWEASHPGTPGDLPAQWASACGVVSGVVHCFLTQIGNNNTYNGYYAPVEIIDPGTYGATLGTATAWTYYRNWGWSTDASYDTYHAKYGMTYDSGGSLIELGGVGNQYGNLPSGLSYHEIGGVRYLYMSYSIQYGNPPSPPPWNLVVCSLDNPGTADAHQTGLATTCSGPYRICAGNSTYGGSQSCGPWRGSWFSDLPSGTMGSNNGFTNSQNPPNTGPALWGGLAWPTTSTPAGFGSTRGGNADYRTTDLIQTVDYLSAYALALGDVNLDGTLNGIPFRVGRRPSYPTASLPPNPPGFKNYAYEGGNGFTYGVTIPAAQTRVDPDQYSGVGNWDNADEPTMAQWVQGTKSGVLFPAAVSVGPVWYKTRTAQEFSPFGTGAHILFARNADEAWTATCFYKNSSGSDCLVSTTQNADVRFDVTAANYTNNPTNKVTVKYQNDGASQSLTCTASGKAVTVHLATNGSSVPTSTANSVVSTVNGTGACSALVTASISLDSGQPNTGAGVIPSVITFDYAGVAVSSNTLILAYGPQLSPREGIDLGIVNTGPVYTQEAGMAVYNSANFEATPDYAVDPDSFIWFRLIDPNFPCATLGSLGTQQCGLTGSFYNPATRRLYVISNAADLTTVPGSPKPIIAVFQIAGSAVPEPLTMADWLWSLAPSFKRLAHLPAGLFLKP